MLRDDESALEQLAAANDAEALCRLLLAAPFGWVRSTLHMEAVEILDRMSTSGQPAISIVALLLCTCRRWDRVTAKLIAAVEDRGLLADADLDDLAAAFLQQALAISYSLAWISPQQLEVDLRDGSVHASTVAADAIGRHRPTVEPPLRRWAAHRALRGDPTRLDDLLLRAAEFEPRHRDALIHGLLDATGVLDEAQRRCLIDPGMKATQAGTRRAALDLLYELDGPEPALRRARTDGNAAVREWRPPSEPIPTPSLFAM